MVNPGSTPVGNAGVPVVAEGAFLPFGTSEESPQQQAMRSALMAIQITDQHGAAIRGLEVKYDMLLSQIREQGFSVQRQSHGVGVQVQRARGEERGEGLIQAIVRGASVGMLFLSALGLFAGVCSGCVWELALPGLFGCLAFGITVMAVFYRGRVGA
jgi:hypothetical protein